MRITILPPRAWDSTWGQEKDLVNVLSKKYAIRIVDLIDFSMRYEATGNKYPVPKNVTIVKRKTRLGPGILFGIYSEIKNLTDVSKRRYDLFITYNTLSSVLAVIWSKIAGKKVILIYADDLAELYKKKSRIAGILTKTVFTPIVAKMSDAIVATSQKLKEDMLNYKKKVWYIPNGVHLGKMRAIKKKNSKSVTVGFIGGFGEWVDFDMVIDCARMIRDVNFILVGNGVQFSYVKKRTRGMSNVKLTGIIPHDKVFEAIASMDICLIPFRVNRLTDRVSPIKLFEYWSMKKPVIATGFYEARRTGEGIIMFANNKEEMKKAINELRNKRLREEIGEKGYEKVKQYDWENLGKKYINIIEGVMSS